MADKKPMSAGLRITLELLHLLRGIILLGGLYLSVHYEAVWLPLIGLSPAGDEDHLMAFMAGGLVAMLAAMPTIILTEKLAKAEAADAHS